MSKKIKVLPKVNNIDFCGRVVYEPTITKSGKLCLFSLIRNFGGDKAPVIMDFVFYKPEAGFPDFLKKGAPIIAHAFVTPRVWTDKEGKEHQEVEKVIKTIELATLVEKTIKDDAREVPEEAGEEAIEADEQ